MSSSLERKRFKYSVKPSRRIGKSKTLSRILKKTLMGGVSIAATAAMLGMSGQAFAATYELDGTTTPVTTFDDADILQNSADTGGDGSATGDTRIFVLGAANDQMASMSIANDGTLTLKDTENTTGNTLTISSNVAITSGKTFTVEFGGSSAATNVVLAIAGNLADGANAGGVAKFTTTNATSTATNGLVTVAGTVNTSDVEIIGAAGGANPGGIMSATFDNAATTDAFKANNLKITGGTASATAVGGAARATIVGGTTLTGDITLTGGDAAAGGVGGTAKLTVEGDVTFNALTFDVGTDGSGNSGGSTTLEVVSDGNQTIDGIMNGAIAGNGLLVIKTKTDGNAPGTATFAKAVGNNFKLKNIAIGSSTNAGAAIFQNTVATDGLTLQAGNAAAEVATATFEQTVNLGATGMTINGGGAVGADATATFKGNLTTVGSITLNDEGTNGNAKLDFTGTGAQAIGGTITPATDGEGTLTVSNTGTVTFANAIGASNLHLELINLVANSTTVFNGAVFAKTMTIGGSARFDAPGNLVGSDSTLNLSSGSKIILGTAIGKNATVFGDGSNAIKVTSAGTVTVEVTATGLTTGDKIILVDSSGTTALGAGSSFDPGHISAAGFTVLNEANAEHSTDASQIVLVKTAAAAASGNIHPQLNTMTAHVVQHIATGVGNTILSRLDRFRHYGKFQRVGARRDATRIRGRSGRYDGPAKGYEKPASGYKKPASGYEKPAKGYEKPAKGYDGPAKGSGRYDGPAKDYEERVKGASSGGTFMETASWIKTFGNWINQDAKDGIDGYDADIYGFVAGIDGEVVKDIRVGVAFGYSNADVDGKGTENINTDIDHYQFSVYGDYTGEGYYIEGMLGYARADNETSSATHSKISYDADQYFASVGFGIPIDMGDDIFVTPKGSLSWTHLEIDNYTWDSQRVNPDDLDNVVAKAGVEVYKRIKQGGGYLLPSAYAGISYDLAGEEVSAVVANTSTIKGMDNEEFAGNIGLGLEYETGAWSIGTKYDGQFKSGQDSHAATLQARYQF